MIGIEKISAKEWNAVVKHSEIGYFTQSYEWMEICHQCFGFEIYPLANHHDNKLHSVFPLVYDTKKKEMLSPPLIGIGGPTILTDLPFYLEEMKHLISGLYVEAVRIQLVYDKETAEILQEFNYNTDHIIPFYILDLSNVKSFEEVQKKVYDERARRGLKRSKSNGIEVERVENNRDILSFAYKIYQKTMVFKKVKNYLPECVFHSIADKFGEHTIIFKAVQEGKVIGVAICFNINNRCLTSWLPLSKFEARKTFVSYALYSHMIQYALSKQIQFVDFGPSGVFTKAHEIKVSHGGKIQWVVTAVWFKNPIRKLKYSFRKSLRKRFIMNPQSRVSKIYQKYILGLKG